eukprot:s3790_g22.t3
MFSPRSKPYFNLERKPGRNPGHRELLKAKSDMSDLGINVGINVGSVRSRNCSRKDRSTSSCAVRPCQRTVVAAASSTSSTDCLHGFCLADTVSVLPSASLFRA